MFFTINAYKIPLESVYRLKCNSNWEPQDNFKEFDLVNDMVFKTHEEAEKWLEKEEILIVNGEKVNVLGAHVSYLGVDNFNIEIVVHRSEKPKLFTIEDLRKLLEEGDDRYNNSLIIDFEGNLKLVQSNPEDIIYHSNYAVSNEVYNSGNGFVGRKLDDLYLRLIYLNLLDNWLLHIQTGRSIYVSCYEDNIDEKKTIYKINKLVMNN
ncbi:hypothetical protein [Clostridium sp. B9]|uniref:hypothetical protein n=1 Tax=Clostridium sp. B9 TaxID=3423224 RepID=UPI003D2F4EFC